MPETYTYPSGFALKYVYNSRGFMSQVRRLDNDNLLWEATEQNQRGQHTDIMFGNGDNISKEFDQYGFPSRYSFYNKAAGGENKANVRNYRFNSATGNLMSQTDHLSGQWESYAYDQQLHNRLVSWSINGTHTSSIDYSNAGNITRKTDVSSQADSYVYNPWNKPHAVVQIDEPQAGFVAQAKEQTIDYTAFNKAETITQAFYAPSVDRHRLRFTYGTDQQRRKMDYYFVGVNGMEIFRSSTFYLDDFERVIDNDISDIHYLSGPTGLFGILTIEDNTETMHYVHTDYLGSYTYITDEDGELAEVLSYDPWGRRRNAYDWTNYNVAPTLFDRGYTGHEHLDQFGLINMNGRVYDPFLARFLSPDPFVQAPEYSQNYNRYSYAWNNPLKYTDPDGEWVHLVIGAAIGGIANLAMNWKSVDNFWDGLGYFAVGAGAGALAAGTGAGFGALASGAGSFSFMSAAGLSAPGLLPGLAVGVSSGFTSGMVTGTGNGLIQGESFKKALGNGFTDGLWGAAFGGVLGGTTGYFRGLKLGLDPITGFGSGGKFGSVPDITRSSLLLDDPVTGLNTNGLRNNGLQNLVPERALKPSLLPSKISGLGEVNAVRGISQAEFTFTKTAGKHLTDFVKHGENAGQLVRPYMKSPLTIQEIMSTGKGVPDSFFKGGMNWRVPGSFRGAQGIWELGINPQTNVIYHFNFTY